MKKVLTGGKFNSIHPGHVYLLQQAKALGSMLVVVLAHDRHNGKPYAVPAEKRKKNIEKLGIANKVLTGHPDSFVQTVLEEKPDIIALGYDQQLPKDVTRELLKQLAIRVVRIKKFGEYGTKAAFRQKNI
ncbi:MAG: adenylyltransferase/cytidyltransferase family protein [Candidatus Aenigmarchaeota archaeon]|nr:adenylyltransferase/cytidyltransferase family protein [Candidatus Aenigmarchaeota archaeon]